MNAGSIESCNVTSSSQISLTTEAGEGLEGGIVGRLHSGVTSITDCISYATLSGGADYKGGIAGYAFDTSESFLSIFSGNTWDSSLYSQIGNVSASPSPTPSSPDNSVSPNPAPDNTSGQNTLLDFSLTSELMSKIAGFFSGISTSDIYKLESSNVLSGTWTPNDSDISYLSRNGENVALTLPELSVSSSGVYVMLCNLGSNLNTGNNIKLRVFSNETPGNVVAGVRGAYVTDAEYIFLDENYNQVTEVPANKRVYIAMRLIAGTTHKSAITIADELPAAVITPYVPESDVLENIAESLSVDVEEINFLTDENISTETPEPTEETKKYVQEDSHEIVGKLNTISVDKEGLYVFKIIIEDDELWKELEGKNVEEVKIYLQSNSEVLNNSVNASFIGILNYWELLTLTGHKMKSFGLREFLIGGFLNSGEPLTLFIAKLILSFFTGGLSGCNSGLGFLCGTGVIGGIIIMKFFRKR